MKRASLILAAAVAASLGADAVQLSPDGTGEALIFPYYTARTVRGNAFNTYLSVVNHTGDTKVLRVHFREGRNARVVQNFNLYLAPNDMWTGAVVPQGAGARVISRDNSCTDGVFDTTDTAVPGRTFSNAQYSAAASDGFGEGLDRTLEGYVEMIEMLTLTGANAAAVSFVAQSVPTNCAAVRPLVTTPPVGPFGQPLPPELRAPTGGLSGTVTLINVTSGQDFTVNAEALMGLATQPYYRPPDDPYPGFGATEITPVSIVVHDNSVYRSVWSRPADAVSAVLMRSRVRSEWVLDTGTRSRTDLVYTFPTRYAYANPDGTHTAPFTTLPILPLSRATMFTREAGGATVPQCNSFLGPPICTGGRFNWASTVSSVVNGSPHLGDGLETWGILGSSNVITDWNPQYSDRSTFIGTLTVSSTFQNGWLDLPFDPDVQGSLTSLPTSTRTHIATGSVTTGAHTYRGYPVTGFQLRTFENGTLTCGAGTCQGNYGGAFPLTYVRSIAAP